MSSRVLSGSGLSSSAAFEVLIGTIISGLFNNMEIPAEVIAMAGRHAENHYFRKPCGLMDQMACSLGGLVHIDFKNAQKPLVKKLKAPFEKAGYCLCITDTGSSHADLTGDYAAIPEEMKSVARLFGAVTLTDISLETVLENAALVRERAGDRALLRAIHFYGETKRATLEAQALERGDTEEFLSLFRQSGDSSYKYLQNIYPPSDTKNQSPALALALSDMYLCSGGAARIHGGGFAGTIQAFVKSDAAEGYKVHMDRFFGTGSCSILRIRDLGGIRLV
jgi:galactokinase